MQPRPPPFPPRRPPGTKFPRCRHTPPAVGLARLSRGASSPPRHYWPAPAAFRLMLTSNGLVETPRDAVPVAPPGLRIGLTRVQREFVPPSLPRCVFIRADTYLPCLLPILPEYIHASFRGLGHGGNTSEIGCPHLKPLAQQYHPKAQTLLRARLPAGQATTCPSFQFENHQILSFLWTLYNPSTRTHLSLPIIRHAFPPEG